MADRTASIVPPLGDICTVSIDPQWPYLPYWRAGNPIGDKLSFAFVDLESGFSDGAQPNYAVTEVVGRAEQYQTFVGTGNREIALTFRFQAQGLAANVAALTASAALAGAFGGISGALVAAGIEANAVPAILMAEVVRPAQWIEALKHPVVDDAELSHAPPPVLLRVGRLIPSVRCIVTQATVDWRPPFDPETLLPYGAEVQVTFTVVRTQILNNLFLERRGG